MELFDMHVHLQDKLYNSELEEVLTRAKDHRVNYMLCNATSQRDWNQVLSLAGKYPQVIPFLGVHPMYLTGISENWLDELDGIIRNTRCGIGEIGLDRRPGSPDATDQEQVFLAQMALAAKKDLPVTIHCVWAWGTMMELLAKITLPSRMLFHAYAGPVDFIKTLAKAGGYFSFGGVVLDEKHRRSREALAAVPLERLLVETDSPDLIPPEPYRLFSKEISPRYFRNEPANAALVYKGIAQMLNIEQNELEKQVFDNAKRFLSGVVD